MFSYLNINSLRNKIGEVSEILTNNYVDVLCLAETKLDASFTSSQFQITDYKVHRKDRNEYGGGLLVYVKASLPHRQLNDFDFGDNSVECMVIEAFLKREKVIFIFVYKPPCVSNDRLIVQLSKRLDKYLSEVKSIFIIGDININLQCIPKPFQDFMCGYSLCNVVKEPTCFKSVSNPTLIDVILTNTPRRLASHVNVAIGMSDHHNIICAATKLCLDQNIRRHITYRSMKHFSMSKYVEDLSMTPFHVCEVFEDPDDVMWCYQTLLKNVVDENAPLKQKTLKKPQVPYMNGALRKAINVKAMLRRKFNKFGDNLSWSRYKHQRNLVTSMKRQSIQQYFNERCNSTTNSRSFWKTVRPFMVESSNRDNNISLCDNDVVITKPSDVCSVFNEYFINIANDLAECENVETMTNDMVIDFYADHDAVKFIKDRVSADENMNFSHVDTSIVCKKLRDLKVNKACGYDMIPAKFLKFGSDVLCYSLTGVINTFIDRNMFPNVCKQAEVSPVYKKKEQLIKSNYRPVSILTAMSKIFESVLCEQIMMYFSNKLSSKLSAYREKYSCCNVITQCVEDWRLSLDNSEKVGCVAMDLSRAFDSIPHGLLVAKLFSYGVSNNACHLIRNYLSNRKQRVKIGNTRSEWLCIKRGIPQGSLMGPVLFNIFVNDLIMKLENVTCIYNYADDNTLSFSHSDVNVIKHELENACKISVEWFQKNNMKANPEKFQFMLVSSKSCENVSLSVNDIEVEPSDHVSILGVTLDNRLNFAQHINGIVKRCSKQTNAVSRLMYVLNSNCKMKILDAFIMANFNYCSIVYHGCRITDAKNLEKMLKRVLQFVYCDFDSSYLDLLIKAGKCPLYVCRQRQVLISVHKIIKGLMPPMSSEFFTVKQSNYSHRNELRLEQRTFHTVTYGQNALKYQGAKLFNDLPNDFKVDDYSDFKSKVMSYDFKCNCGNCFLCSLKCF